MSRYKPALKMAQTLGTHIRNRVQKRGNMPGNPPQYSSNTKSKKLIAPGYPGVSGTQLSTGAYLFESSKDFHRSMGTRHSTFSVSGGMWSGLMTMTRGYRDAVIAFRGRSPGYEARFKRYKSKGNKTLAKKAKKINNSWKSYRIVLAYKLNPLQPYDSEVRLMGSALRHVLFGTTIKQVGGILSLKQANLTTGMSRFGQSMIRAVEASR